MSDTPASISRYDPEVWFNHLHPIYEPYAEVPLVRFRARGGPGRAAPYRNTHARAASHFLSLRRRQLFPRLFGRFGMRGGSRRAVTLRGIDVRGGIRRTVLLRRISARGHRDRGLGSECRIRWMQIMGRLSLVGSVLFIVFQHAAITSFTTLGAHSRGSIAPTAVVVVRSTVTRQRIPPLAIVPIIVRIRRNGDCSGRTVVGGRIIDRIVLPCPVVVIHPTVVRQPIPPSAVVVSISPTVTTAPIPPEGTAISFVRNDTGRHPRTTASFNMYPRIRTYVSFCITHADVNTFSAGSRPFGASCSTTSTLALAGH